VIHYGSEAVNNYFSPIYPPAPSAAGSVISRDLVLYLTNNMNHLFHGFTNIANSLAIWLAPIGPTYYDEPDWFDDLEASLSASEVIGVGHITQRRVMQGLHFNLTKCGRVLC